MFATILWASDGSDWAAGRLGWVADLAAAEGAVLWVVYVAGSRGASGSVDDGEEASIARLKEQVRDLRRRGLAASLYVIRGARGPVRAALDAAAGSTGADLVIVGGGRRLDDAASASHDSATQILAAASYPVLILPDALNLRQATAEARV